MNLTVRPVEKAPAGEGQMCQKTGAISGRRVCTKLATYVVAFREPEFEETEQVLCVTHANFAIAVAMEKMRQETLL